MPDVLRNSAVHLPVFHRYLPLFRFFSRVVWYPKKWYGISNFGSTSSGQPFAVGSLSVAAGVVESAGVCDPNPTRFARMECQKYHFGFVFPVSYFHFATDSPEIGQFCAGRRPADENLLPALGFSKFWQQVATCPASGIFTTKKWYLPLVGSPAPGALGSPGAGPAYR